MKYGLIIIAMLFFLTALFLPPAGALADGGPEKVADELTEEGIKCYEELSFQCAVEKLSAALAYHNSVRIHQYLAYSFIALDEKERGVTEFRKALEMDDNFLLRPGEVSPKIYEVYLEARRRYLADRQESRERETAERAERRREGWISFNEVDLSRRPTLELDLGYENPFGDKVNGVDDYYEPALSVGGTLRYGFSRWLTLGVGTRYSSHEARGEPGARSMDILHTIGLVSLRKVTDNFVFYAQGGGGAAFTGQDGVSDRMGGTALAGGGVEAIVSERVSLGLEVDYQPLFSAGVPGDDLTHLLGVYFKVVYLFPFQLGGGDAEGAPGR